MKPTKKKPVKRAATVAKPATVEPMATRTYIAYVKGYGYVIADKDLPRVADAMANVLATRTGWEHVSTHEIIAAHDLLRAIGIEVP